MNYTVMVFDPTKAPATREKFIAWHKKLINEMNAHNTCASTSLKHWFREMVRYFPATRGPFSPADEEIEHNEGLKEQMADYYYAADAIYIVFPYGEPDEAYEMARELAVKNNVGVFDMSRSGDVILPNGSILD